MCEVLKKVNRITPLTLTRNIQDCDSGGGGQLASQPGSSETENRTMRGKSFQRFMVHKVVVARSEFRQLYLCRFSTVVFSDLIKDQLDRSMQLQIFSLTILTSNTIVLPNCFNVVKNNKKSKLFKALLY